VSTGERDFETKHLFLCSSFQLILTPNLALTDAVGGANATFQWGKTGNLSLGAPQLALDNECSGRKTLLYECNLLLERARHVIQALHRRPQTKQIFA